MGCVGVGWLGHPPVETRIWSPMAARTRSRAWCSRLLKAAWPMPAISAASWVDSPSTSRSTMAVRNGGGNSARARPSAWRSSLFSACREGSSRGIGQLQLVRPDRDTGRPAGPFLQRAVGLVDRDPVEPGEVAGLAAEPGDALPGAQHDLLGHVLGFAAVAQQPQQQHEQAIGVRAGQPLEGADVPGLGAGEQARFGVRGFGRTLAGQRRHHAFCDEAEPPGPASRARSKIVAGARTPASPSRPCRA